jgi:hypothetical protein
MSPVKYKIIHIQIHPPEADALADSRAEASRSALAYTDELVKAPSEMDSGWQEEQKNRFWDSFRPLISESREYALSSLQEIEKWFPAIPVDAEEQMPVCPP